MRLKANGSIQRGNRRVRVRSETSDQRAKTRARVRKTACTKRVYEMKTRAKACTGEIGRLDSCHLKFGEFKRKFKLKAEKFKFRATLEGSILQWSR